MHGARRRLAAFLLLGACAPDPGVANVQFLFEGGLPTLAEAVDVTARVEEREDPAAPGPVLASTPPARIPAGPLEALSLSPLAIPNGARRVVIAELRSVSSPDRVLYYGVSAPFEIHPGDVLDVPVRVQPITPPERSRVEILAVHRGFVGAPAVELRLTTDRGTRVRLSNVVTFPERATVILELAALSPEAGGARAFRTAWDLDRDLDAPCLDSDACPRTVFARFIDAEGYQSTTRTSSVVLDTRAPEILPGSATLELAPPPGLLRQVTRAREGTRVTVTFTASELLQGPPDVALSGGSPLPFETCVPSGLSHRCSLTYTARDPGEARHTVTATLVDRAGHARAVSLAELVGDTVAPSPPATQAHGRVVLHRAPWGTSAAPGDARFEIRGAAGAVEPGSLLVALDRRAIDQALELSRTTTPAAADGSFSGLRLGADRAEVFLVSVDAAGNASDAAPETAVIEGAPVLEQRWSVAFSDRPASPHRVEATAIAEETRSLDPAVSRELFGAELGALASADGREIAQVGRPSWRERTPPASLPSARYNHGLAFDRARGRAVLFGGFDGTRVLSDTWEWDGRDWIPAPTIGSVPEPRSNHAIAFDRERTATLLFGGEGVGGRLDDSWSWNGARWTPLSPAHAPSPRRNHAMAYDAARGRVVLFGGESLPLIVNGETWEWDGLDWTQTSTRAGPPARWAHALAFDPVSNEVVLFGGEDLGASALLGDTWVWDGQRWRDRTSTSTSTSTSTGSGGPSPRRDHTLAFDAALGMVVMTGGMIDRSDVMSDEVWAWNGATSAWRRLPASARRPSARGAHAAAEISGGVILFGGRNHLDLSGDLWRIDGGVPREITPRFTWPGARSRAALAFDPIAQRAVLFGGLDAERAWQSDAFAWDGYAWSAIETPTVAAALSSPALAVDTARQRLVLVGARGASLQVLEQVGDRFRPITSTSPAPTAREWAPLAADPVTSQVLLFGGFDTARQVELDALLAWSGAEWRALSQSTPRPSARLGHSLATDTARGRLIACGGRGVDPLLPFETWEWDGARWAGPLITSPAPPDRWASAITFDPVRERTILAGGVGADLQTVDDLWSWNGQAWTRLDPASATPPSRGMASMTYDASRRRLLYFGGVQGDDQGAPGRDLWELRADSEDRPAIEASIGFTSASIPRTDVESMSIQAFAGASGEGPAGAALELWDARAAAWAVVATNQAPESAGAVLDARVEGAQRFVGGDGWIVFRIRSRSPQGRSSATVRVDALALEIAARLSGR
ncbi:MAG: hypothetical protein IT384_14885 [Deltaproteobacteria bacterium]|nr:hypothetical protein [Deltaproteobacteria bacterium]